MNRYLSRRQFVQSSLALGVFPLSTMIHAPTNQPLHVVCIGAHPDDPETGCGGTLIRFSNAGHRVTVIYLTNGDSGVKGKSLQEAAAIRVNESEKACEIMKARPVFVGQVNGHTVVDNDLYDKISRLLTDEKPDILFTHWPIDSHKEHMATFSLTYRAYIQSDAQYPLYFYEVCTGRQTQNFQPTEYVDISDVREQKIDAVCCHESQGFNREKYYRIDHGLMDDFRGLTIRVKAAEAFVKALNSSNTMI